MAEALTKYLDPQVIARLMAQPLTARFAMEGTVSGHHRSPHRGSSVEFAEYRNYVPGDDLRRLDWRVLGRTDRYYLKEFEAETNLRGYFVLDCSASMKFAGTGEAKIEYAKRMLAALSYLTVHQGDAAGLLCVGPTAVQDVPPRRNPAHLQTLLRLLDGVEGAGETGLVASLHELAERVKHRALVVIFSDFFCDLEPLLSALQHLRFRKHDLVLFHLLDRMELEFKFDRPVRFQDLESNFSLVTEPVSIRDEYLRQFAMFVEGLKKGCREFKADYRQVITDQEYGRVLSDFLVERARLAAMGVQ